MLKVSLALGFVIALFVVDSTCQKLILPTFRPDTGRPLIILPTYKPPVTYRPLTRFAREAGPGDLSPPREEVAPLPVITTHSDRTVRSLDSPSAKRGGGTHPTSSGSRNTGATPPGYNRRNARSVDSPSAKRGGGSPGTSSGSGDTGPTHPGYNRRNTRDITLPEFFNLPRPEPRYPGPTFPVPVPRIPIIARTARDIQIPGAKKPTYRDVIIPNWNPNVKTDPWNRIGGRHGRSLDFADAESELIPHERQARDIYIPGLPEFKMPKFLGVVIPNENPN